MQSGRVSRSSCSALPMEGPDHLDVGVGVDDQLLDQHRVGAVVLDQQQRDGPVVGRSGAGHRHHLRVIGARIGDSILCQITSAAL